MERAAHIFNKVKAFADIDVGRIGIIVIEIIAIIRYNYNNAGDKRYAGIADAQATVGKK